MTRQASRRTAMGLMATTSLVTFVLGLLAAGLVAGLATAASTTSTATSRSTTKGTTTGPAVDPSSPEALYSVVNGTANAASDHEIVASSAFPNYSTGAVDNYYSMAHSHVDNSPFAEGKASPADTGPVGQTAAAGNTQQPQYADARWPGDSGKATYGSQGSPYAAATAGDWNATAEASDASTGLNGAAPSTKMAAPRGFDGRLRQALSAWKAKWQGRLHLLPATKAVTPPAATVTTPVATVTTPTVTVGGLTTPAVSVPSVSVPAVPAPPAVVPQAAPTRSLQSSAAPPPADGAALLESSTRSLVDPKTHALVTSGESSLGRVSIGGGQIVLQGIHVSASISNDGTSPTDKVAVTVGTASIAGIPVTIDQDGVHVAAQGQGLPYAQASDALNGALKQAGIELFLVTPEITNGSSCGATSDSGACGGSGTDTTTTDTTTTDTTTTTMTTTDTTTTASSLGTCTGTTGTTTSTEPTTTTSTTDTTTTSTLPGFGFGTGSSTGGADPGEETLTATGVHLVFTQPVDQPGVPAQHVEHILGEVYLDSLAVPATASSDLGLGLGNLGFGNLGGLNGSLGSCRAAGGHARRTKKLAAVSVRGGGSSAGGAQSSSSPTSGSSSPAQPASGFTAGGSQPVSGTPGAAAPATQSGFVAALKKPKWLLIAYLVWQALMIATGASVWHWRRGGTA